MTRVWLLIYFVMMFVVGAGCLQCIPDSYQTIIIDDKFVVEHGITSDTYYIICSGADVCNDGGGSGVMEFSGDFVEENVKMYDKVEIGHQYVVRAGSRGSGSCLPLIKEVLTEVK